MKKIALLLILLGVGSSVRGFCWGPLEAGNDVEEFKQAFDLKWAELKGGPEGRVKKFTSSGYMGSFLAIQFHYGFRFGGKVIIKPRKTKPKLFQEVNKFLAGRNVPVFDPCSGDARRSTAEKSVKLAAEKFPGCFEASLSKLHRLLNQAKEERRTYRARLRKRKGSKRAAEQGIFECNKRIKNLKEDIQANS